MSGQPPAAGLALDLAAVADVAGLTEEVALLRASIRRLAQHADAAEQVKVLANPAKINCSLQTCGAGAQLSFLQTFEPGL